MKEKTSKTKLHIFPAMVYLSFLFCFCSLFHIHVLSEEKDTIPPTIKVEITDADKEFTSKIRKATVKITDNKMVGEINKEYVFKEGKDSFRISIKDAAGNESTYKSDVYIQDYTDPEIITEGIEDGQTINGELNINIYAIDEWLDTKKSQVKIKGQNSLDEYDYFFAEDEKRINIFDFNSFRDDYYTLNVYLSDEAGNEIERVISFMINRKGSVFDLDNKNKEKIGRISDEITDFSITEKNLSQVDTESARILFAFNARVINLNYGTDYRIEEEKTEEGYIYTYIFSNDLFIKDGIYTISVSTTDEAGNVNDTRFGKDTDEIRFAVKKGPETSYNKK